MRPETMPGGRDDAPRWLKFVHSLAAKIWFLGLCALLYLLTTASGGSVLKALETADTIRSLIWYMIVPGAAIAALSGIWLAIAGKRGFPGPAWLLGKWAIAIAVSVCLPLAVFPGAHAYGTLAWQEYAPLTLAAGGIAVLLLLIAFPLSTFKPGSPRNQEPGATETDQGQSPESGSHH